MRRIVDRRWDGNGLRQTDWITHCREKKGKGKQERNREKEIEELNKEKKKSLTKKKIKKDINHTIKSFNK